MKLLVDRRGFAVHETDSRRGAVHMDAIHTGRQHRPDLGGLAIVAMLVLSIAAELAFVGCLVKTWVAR